MKVRDWEEKLNAFLQFNDYEVLQNKGRISREVAQALAEQEYEVFRITQDEAKKLSRRKFKLLIYSKPTSKGGAE